MRRTGGAAVPTTPPRRRIGATTQQPATPPAAPPAVCKPKPFKIATATTPSKHPARPPLISPTKRPPLTSPSKPQTKPAASPSRLPVHRSPQRSPSSIKPNTQSAASKPCIQPVTARPASNVQIWNFDDQSSSDDHTQQHDEKEHEPHSISISALFSDWPSTDSSVLSFQSLSAYTLPPLPSYDRIPALCDRLLVGDDGSVDGLYGAVCGFREYGASDLLASPYVSMVVSSLVPTVLLLSAPLLSVASASLLLLADLFDAAHSSHTAAELYLALVQHVLHTWPTTAHWPAAHADIWLESSSQSATDKSIATGTNNGPANSHSHCSSHAHLIRLARFITIMQRQLPDQWVYFSPSTHHSLITATLQLYTTAVSSPSTTLLSPAQLLAIVDPLCGWLPLWLYQLPARKLIVQLLGSPEYVAVIDWMVAPLPETTSDDLSVVSAETVPVCVPSSATIVLSALQRARFVQCLMRHGSGRLLLKSARERAALPRRTQDELQGDIQRLQLAAQHSMTEADDTER